MQAFEGCDQVITPMQVWITDIPQVNMHPVGNNMLRGSGTFSLTPTTVVVVFMKLPNQDGYAARFTPLKPKGDQGDKAPSHADDAGPHHHHHSPKH